jgi:hypothetical protein
MRIDGTFVQGASHETLDVDYCEAAAGGLGLKAGRPGYDLANDWPKGSPSGVEPWRRGLRGPLRHGGRCSAGRRGRSGSLRLRPGRRRAVQAAGGACLNRYDGGCARSAGVCCGDNATPGCRASQGFTYSKTDDPSCVTVQPGACQ